MSGNEQRRIPVEAIWRIAILGSGRANTERFVVAQIAALQIAVLGFGVDGLRVFGVGLHIKTVAAADHEPITVRNSSFEPCAAGPAPFCVVLIAGAYVIRLLIVV